jgi:endo-1,4-beta-xylanase
VFQQKLGSDWIREALQFAYQQDPTATFIAVNEFNADGMNAKADKLYSYYKNTLVGAIPSAHLAVGLQMHLDPCAGGFRSPPPSEIERNMKRLAALGIQVHITEMDYAIRCLSGTQASKLEAQKAMYHDIVAACYRLAACTAFSTWGIGDKDSWIRTNNGHYDWPLLFDDGYQPKPAFQGVVDALNGR